jgi:GAF domain-containing protein
VSPAADTQPAFEIFLSTLESDGVRPSLQYLLHRTDYRFIGIWRFQDGKANAAVHYDRKNPTLLTAQEVPATATYCCYVRDSRGVFMTADAMLDPRTEGHPARHVVPAYCGVPILDAEGVLLGTLCHYDLVPRDPGQVDLELMLQVASALAQSGRIPPYPSA